MFLLKVSSPSLFMFFFRLKSLLLFIEKKKVGEQLGSKQNSFSKFIRLENL